MKSALGQRKSSAAEKVLAGGGEMGARMRTLDWSQTSLGPVEGWPQSLRTAVGLCLDSCDPIGIFWGAALVQIYNDAYRPILGTTRHPAALGRRADDCQPEIWDVVGPLIEAVLKTGQAARSDDLLLILDRNGEPEECSFTFSCTPIRAANAGAGGVFCTALETTTRALRELAAGAAEAKLAEFERADRLQAVTALLAEALTPDQVAEVIIAQGLAALGARAGSIAQLVDGDTALEIVSEFGYHEDLVDPWRRFSIDHPAPMADAVRAASPVWLGSPAERAARYPGLAPISADDGAWVALPLLVKGRPIGAIGLSFAEPRVFDADDQAFMLTLTQQCALALDRARLYVEAEAAVAARDELLSVVSHDLKNPLATVKGFAQLLRRRVARMGTPEAARLLDGLDKIDAAARRMSAQIADLLDAVRLHAGQPLDLDRQPTNLVTLAHQVAAEHQQTTQSHTIHVESAAEELVGSYDATRIERIFANLLQNAIKYSPQGGVIAVELAHEICDGVNWATVVVSDQGIGIPADDLPRIFERFHRAGNVAGQIQGTGIGLSSAQQIVEQHGGTISVVSQEGVGSRFTVRLPLEATSSEF
jgi:signal transduction histidine kinase